MAYVSVYNDANDWSYIHCIKNKAISSQEI